MLSVYHLIILIISYLVYDTLYDLLLLAIETFWIIYRSLSINYY